MRPARATDTGPRPEQLVRGALRCPEPDVKAGHRVLIVGPNGCGKSTLGSAIANGFGRRVLVYDPKAEPEAVLPNSAEVVGVRAALRALPGRVIYRPSLADMSDLPGAFDELAARVWQTGGHCCLLIHETMDVAPSGGRTGPSLSRAIRQGRHPLRIPIIFVTQRAAWIDRLAVSESAHVYLFSQRDKRDLSTISSVMGAPPESLAPPGIEHAFYHRGPSGPVHLHGPLNLSR